MDKELIARAEAVLNMPNAILSNGSIVGGPLQASDLRALLTAAQGQEWRPIAEAPRDGGEPFWIGSPGFIALAVWNVGDGALRLVRQQIAGEPFGGEPTHWCPHALPNFIPPNPSAAEG